MKSSELYNNQIDREQYSKYKKVLGDKAPANIDEFLKIKYNNIDKWNDLKRDYADENGIYSEYQANQYINLVKGKFREGSQGKHIIGHNNYKDGNSYVTISNEHIQKLVKKYAITREKNYSRTNNKWTKTEKIITDEIIGVYINKNYNKLCFTNSFTIKYSKEGYRIAHADYTEKEK